MPSHPYSVTDAVTTYLAEVTPAKADSTQRNDALYARKIVEHLGDLPIADLGTPDVYQLQRALAATPILANRVVSLVSQICAHAERTGERPTDSNPTRALRRYRERPATEFLRASQRRAFVESVWACTQRGEITASAGCACLLLLLAGLRLRGALDLRWSEVDLDAGVIRLADRDERGTNKTSEHRARPITDDVVSILRTMPRWCAWVCPNPRTRAPYVDIRKSMARVCEVAGLSPRLRRHALRHSFGTALAESGMTSEEIAAWLGHQSPATAARYTHLTAPTMRRHAARVGAALRGVT